MAREKSWITGPPHTRSATTASRVVREVLMVRERVWLMESLSRGTMPLESPHQFSRTRSNTTMVSFREYPTMVRMAAMNDTPTSRCRRLKTPRVIMAS